MGMACSRDGSRGVVGFWFLVGMEAYARRAAATVGRDRSDRGLRRRVRMEDDMIAVRLGSMAGRIERCRAALS